MTIVKASKEKYSACGKLIISVKIALAENGAGRKSTGKNEDP